MVVYLQLLSSWPTQCQLPENRCVSLKYAFYGGVAWRLRYTVLMTVWFWLEILCCISSGPINVRSQRSGFSKLGSMRENTQNMPWHRKIRFLGLYTWFSLGPQTEWFHTLRVIKTMRTKLTWLRRPALVDSQQVDSHGRYAKPHLAHITCKFTFCSCTKRERVKLSLAQLNKPANIKKQS